MTEVVRAAADLQNFCEARAWRFCLIGGLALQRWGEPRETVDVDLTLLTGFGGEEPFVRTLLQHFEARIPSAAEFAMTRRVLLLRAASGVGLDIALAGLPFEESVVARSSLFAFPVDVLLRTCSAEDLIVLKAFAARTSTATSLRLRNSKEHLRSWWTWKNADRNSSESELSSQPFLFRGRRGMGRPLCTIGLACKSNLLSYENACASDVNQRVVRGNWTPPIEINAVLAWGKRSRVGG